MRGKAQIGGIRQRPVAPARRTLALALSLLMLLASFPMDVTAAVLDRIAAPSAVARLGGQDFAEPRVTEYGYDEIGARSYVRRWNGVETEYGYDALDRLVSLEHRSANGNPVASFSYSYQADGRRSSAVEDTPTGTSIVRYSYDALGRLISETRTGGAHPFSAAYAYDLNGNRLARTVAADGVTEATSYSYDDNDRLLVETTDGAATQYAYDGNGSLVSTDASETKKRGGNLHCRHGTGFRAFHNTPFSNPVVQSAFNNAVFFANEFRRAAFKILCQEGIIYLMT